MLADAHVGWVHRWRQHMAVVVAPTQYASRVPERVASWVYDSVFQDQRILFENARLRAQNLLLQAKIQQLEQYTKANHQLQSLLHSSLQFKSQQTLVARIMAVDPLLARRQVIIDQGSRHQVYRNQVVLAAQGVLGRVIGVTPLTARVMLLTDPQSAIPVEDLKTKQRAIAVGQLHQDRLQLQMLGDTNTVAIGDQWVTSGLGLRFPPGYPVGRVVQIQRYSRQQGATLWLQPVVPMEQVQRVLLLWPQSAKQVASARQQLQQAPISLADTHDATGQP